MALQNLTMRELVKACLIGLVVFIVLGTSTALWQNPFSTRMTPTSGFEIGALAMEALLMGLYFGIARNQACAPKKAGFGGVLGFLGIACPVCNKLLVFLFGFTFLLTYLEPLRPYFTILGILLLLWAVQQKLLLKRIPRTI